MTIAPAASPAAPGSAPGSAVPLVDSALRAAAGLTGMPFVFVSSIEAETYTWRAVRGALPGIAAGQSVPLADTFCSRLLRGAPANTADAALDPAYADVPMRALGVTAYVGVPVRKAGVVTGTLGGLSTTPKVVSPVDVDVLAAVGRLLIPKDHHDPDVRLHRSASGWLVEQGGASEPAEDLAVAMSLADILLAEAAELPAPPRPARPGDDLTEADRLRVQIIQLEHALSARVVIEQAIGVTAERFGIPAREAFNRLRKSARNRGQRVHDLAVLVVRSTRDDAVDLPKELR